jgi:hypothetical protein
VSAVTFDTLKFADTLKAAGISASHAEAEARAIAAAAGDLDLATQRDISDVRRDIGQLETSLTAKLDNLEMRVKGRLTLLQWMFGILITGILTLMLKAFFPI